MKNKAENKLLAVIRVRGRVGVHWRIAETLSRMNLKRVNNMVLMYGNKSNLGMIKTCNDHVTYGEIAPDVLNALIEKKEIKLTKEQLKEVAEGKKPMREFSAPTIRMHPPRRGYEGNKKGFSVGGSLGYRGEEINALIKRML